MPAAIKSARIIRLVLAGHLKSGSLGLRLAVNSEISSASPAGSCLNRLVPFLAMTASPHARLRREPGPTPSARGTCLRRSTVATVVR